MTMMRSLFTAAALAAAVLTVQAAPVAPTHQQRLGMQCETCHTQMPKADWKKCLMCHGPAEKLAKTNAQHGALKSGEVPCSVCHQGHQ